MHTNLPKADDIKIASLQEANEIIKLLILKIEEMEERETIRDTGLVEEIIHLRKETKDGFDRLENKFESLENKFESLEDRIDKNTLAVKSLEIRFDSLESTVKGGFENVGQILQEISNKLDKA